MSKRKFSLANEYYEITPAVVSLFKWDHLDIDVSHQLGFEEQYLEFHRYLLENLRSVPAEYPNREPWPLGLSLRAGAVKAYVVLASSIVEGALASWGKELGICRKPEQLMKLPLGGLLKSWAPDGSPRSEVEPIWKELNLLLEYRNFIHLGKSATDENAYWKNVLERESELLAAADKAIDYLST